MEREANARGSQGSWAAAPIQPQWTMLPACSFFGGEPLLPPFLVGISVCDRGTSSIGAESGTSWYPNGQIPQQGAGSLQFTSYLPPAPHTCVSSAWPLNHPGPVRGPSSSRPPSSPLPVCFHCQQFNAARLERALSGGLCGPGSWHRFGTQRGFCGASAVLLLVAPPRTQGGPKVWLGAVGVLPSLAFSAAGTRARVSGGGWCRAEAVGGTRTRGGHALRPSSGGSRR